MKNEKCFALWHKINGHQNSRRGVWCNLRAWLFSWHNFHALYMRCIHRPKGGFKGPSGYAPPPPCQFPLSSQLLFFVPNLFTVGILALLEHLSSTQCRSANEDLIIHCYALLTNILHAGPRRFATWSVKSIDSSKNSKKSLFVEIAPGSQHEIPVLNKKDQMQRVRIWE